MKSEKIFNQEVYKNAYNKKNYSNVGLRIRPEKAQKIADFCEKNGYSKNDFFVRAALYIIDNNINLSTLDKMPEMPED